MSKYSGQDITAVQMRDISELIDMLRGFGQGNVTLDHMQIGDAQGNIIGKLQYDTGRWTFRARRHDKPAALGE